MASYRVIYAKTQGGVIAAAQTRGYALVTPVFDFDDFDSDHDAVLTGRGDISVFESGFVALAKK